MVFINKGAGNFPKSSPKRVLLYRVRNVLKVYHTSIKKSVLSTSAGEISTFDALGNVSRVSPEL